MEKLCEICKKELLEGDETVTCPDCGKVHHKTCWDSAGGCASEECKAKSEVKAEKEETLQEKAENREEDIERKNELQTIVSDVVIEKSEETDRQHLNTSPKNKIVVRIIAAVFIVAILLPIILLFPTKAKKLSKDFNKRIDTETVKINALLSDNNVISIIIAKNIYNNIDSMISEYENMEEKVRQKIDYDDYTYAVAKSYDTYVKALSSEYDEDNIERLESLKQKYYNYAEDIKGKIEEHEGIIDTIVSLKKRKAEAAVEEICSLKNDGVAEMKSIFEENKGYMTETQIEACLNQYRKWGSYNIGIDYMKSCMKNPASFYVDSGTIDSFKKESDGSYTLWATVQYYATNSFGAYLTESSMLCVSVYASDTDMIITRVANKFYI